MQNKIMKAKTHNQQQITVNRLLTTDNPQLRFTTLLTNNTFINHNKSYFYHSKFD